MNARRLFAIVSVVALTLAGADAVHALVPEEASGHLELLKTQIKTTGGLVAAGTTVQLFTPTTVTCPTRSCTVRVEISLRFWGQTPQTYGVALIKVDGASSGIQPSDYASFADGGGTNAFSSQTFTFMKEGLGTGKHSVTADFTAVNAVVNLDGATLTVQTFTP